MIAGVQVTMNTFFKTISMVVALYASTAENFIYLVWMSVVVETVILVIYSRFAWIYSRGGVSGSATVQPQILEEDLSSERGGSVV